MQILCNVDQKAALRRGHNAPASTVKIDIDPTILTQPERDVLAAVLSDGHDATRSGLFVGGESAGSLVLTRPDVEGLREGVAGLIARRDAILAKQAAKAAQAKAQWDEIRVKPAEIVTKNVRADGQVTSWQDDAIVSISCPERPWYVSTYYDLTDEDRADYEAWKAEVEAANAAAEQAAIAAAGPEIARIVAERAAAREAERRAKTEAKERRAAQIAAKVAEVGGILAERWAAGRAKESEIADLIARDERAARGVSYTGSAAEWDRVDCDELPSDHPLTNDQWIALRDWRSKLPEDAAITLWDLHDHAEDEDGETTARAINRLLVAEATWSVGEVAVKADTQIGTLPDEGA